MVFIHKHTGSPTPVPDAKVAELVVSYLDEDFSGFWSGKSGWTGLLSHLTMLDAGRKEIYKTNGGINAEIIVDFLDMVVLLASKRTKDMVKEIWDGYEQRSEGHESSVPAIPKPLMTAIGLL